MLNNYIVNQHLKKLGLSGSRITIQEIKSRYKEIAELFDPNTFDQTKFKEIQESYQFLKSSYMTVKDYVNGIPVYEVNLKLSDIYCNRIYKINGIEFTACSSCLKPLHNYQTCILLYKVHSENGFKYNGIDLLYELEIDVLDALVGTSKTIKLLDDSLLEVTIPPNSNHDSVITIHNSGLSDNKSTGNLYIKLKTISPMLTENKIKELKQFIRTNLR